MIKIIMFDNNWRIIIGDEIWEFEDLKEMEVALISILNIKNNYGRNGK
jgi:hypothetical protein